MKTVKFFALLFTLNLFFACNVDSQNWYGGKGISGEGKVVTETLDLSSFDAFGLTINADVFLTQGSQSVKIEAQRNIIENIKMDVDDGYWKIKYKENVKKHEPITIWISIPDLSAVAVSGSGDVQGKSMFRNCGKLRLAVSGSGNIDLDSESTELKAAVSGSGDMDLGGETGAMAISIAGSGDVDAGDLEASDCKVKIAGSGDASVHVNDNLEVGIAGSGDVVYRGNPRVKSKIAGSGDVRSK